MAITTKHLFSGHAEADTPEWHALYHHPEFVNAICKRCGCSVGDLTQHEEWHAQRD